MSNELIKVYNTAVSRFRSRLSKREASEGLNYDYIHDAVEEIIRRPEGFNISTNKTGYMLSVARNIRSRRLNVDQRRSKVMHESFVIPFSEFPPIMIEGVGETTSPELSMEDGSCGLFVPEEQVYDTLVVMDVSKWLLSSSGDNISYSHKIKKRPARRYNGSRSNQIDVDRTWINQNSPQNIKKALMMSIEGYSVKEIAGKLKTSKKQIEYLIHEGKVELNSKFSNE